MTDHIPRGFQALTPYLSIEGADAFITFAHDALGATQRAIHRADGRIMHAELELHDCIIELSERPPGSSATCARFHVFVRDPDAAYARAMEHGATSLYAVQDHDYGERSGGVSDAWGNQWYFAAVIDHARREG